jgi:ankyrin repeat protein
MSLCLKITISSGTFQEQRMTLLIDDTWHEIIKFINNEDLVPLTLVNKVLYSYTEQHSLSRAKNMTCTEIVKHFSSKILDTVITEHPDIQVNDALVQAVENRNLKQVQLIIEKCKNLDINYCGAKPSYARMKSVSRKPTMIMVKSDDALTVALRTNQNEIVKLLLEHPDIAVEASSITELCKSKDNFEFAKHFIKSYCKSDIEKANALEQAISNNNEKLVKYMLNELNYDMTWISENTLWFSLSQAANSELFEIALSDRRLNPTANMYTIVFGCMVHCNIETTKVLMKHPKIDISLHNFYILSTRSIEHLKEFLKDPRVNPSANNNNYVLQAFNLTESSSQNLDRVKLFVRHSGFDPTIRKTQLLLKAVQCNYEELAILVLSTPGEYELDDIWSVLENVIQKRNIVLLKRIVKDNRIPLKGALSVACYVGDLDIVQVLLESGRVEVNEDDNSPIADACRGKQLDIILWILQNYPDSIEPSNRKNIVFTTVVEYGRMDILRTLLDNPKLQLDNSCLAKALRVSCKKQYKEIIQFLLEKTNVDPTELDYEAFKIAKKYCTDSDIIQIISSHKKVDPVQVEKAILKSPITM